MGLDPQVNNQYESIHVPIVPVEAEGQTMSSREIADLLEARHDNVRRTIERLAERGVIQLPPMEEVRNHQGQGVSEYRVSKRDSYVIVAQLSPEFTARLVDRWQELEARAADPMRALSDPVTMRGLLLTYSEKVLQLQAANAELVPKAEALDRIATADGSLNITEAAKALQMRPKDLFSYLCEHGWTYRRPGASSWLGYQSKTNSGLLEHKVTTVLRADGSEKITEQVRVTSKGLARLAKLLQPTAMLVAKAA